MNIPAETLDKHTDKAVTAVTGGCGCMILKIDNDQIL